MQTDKKITIVEIAKACGVSKTTVGYALDERTAAKVSPRKMALINSTVKRLGYVPNHSAKSLRTQKNYIIGVMLPDPANSFYGRMALILQRELAKKGYIALFSFWDNFNDAANIDKTLKMFISRGVDGIITCDLPGVHFEKSIAPVVFWEEAPGGFDSVCSIIHTEKIYRNLIRILKDRGSRTFSVMVPCLNLGRAREILAALEAENAYPRPSHLFAGVSACGTAQVAMRKLIAMSKHPDVVLCNNDSIAMGAMAEAQKAGIKVPQEMKFTGFDGTEISEH
ncbi:MAG: LacI family DNA-binding transcriptional regulator, partial [Lentisphaerota bacterium]